MDQELTALAVAQGGVFTIAQARRTHTGEQIRRLLQRGEWLAVRRGVYAEAAVAAAGPAHRLQVAARVLITGGDVVVSHRSAAVLHGFPLIEPPETPTLTVVRASGEAVARATDLRSAGLPAGHRTTLWALPITTPARTVADLLRESDDHLQAVAFADAALRSGLDRAAVEAVLADCGRWPGVRRAGAALAFADARAESPLESRCRVWFARQGLPAPSPQVRIINDRGREIARVDFLFREQRTVCEADGRVKYDDPEALWREKRREDLLRELGLEVVRATWADGEDGGRALAERLRRAFARAAARSW